MLVHKLDQFIQHYQNTASDIKLVNTLDSGAGIYNSIVSDLITSCRTYNSENYDTSRSSTMNSVFDIYMTTLMAIMRSNAIQESAINLKTAITGEYYEDDRRYIHNNRNAIYKTFFKSIQKAFTILNEDDAIGFIDLTVCGNNKTVRMVNVIQIFWQTESGLNSTQSSCKLLQNYTFSRNDCHGRIMKCEIPEKSRFFFPYLILSYQQPIVDRIYYGYDFNNIGWCGINDHEKITIRVRLIKKIYKKYFLCELSG